jgi:hypothetical protein
MNSNHKAKIRTTDLARGWAADQYTDRSMDIRNDRQRQLIDLAPASVDTLRQALRGAVPIKR